MTRKKLNGVITDCDQCPHFKEDGRITRCREAEGTMMDPAWWDHTGEPGDGYIPEWCPLEDAEPVEPVVDTTEITDPFTEEEDYDD